MRMCCTSVFVSHTWGAVCSVLNIREIFTSSNAEKVMNRGHSNVFIEQFHPEHHFRLRGLGKRWQTPTYTRSVRSDWRHICV